MGNQVVIITTIETLNANPQKGKTMENRNRKFGIEIEFVGASMSYVADKLNNAGITAQVESYNHLTRTHWKVTSDVSVQHSSGLAGELVSPILQGLEGFAELKKVCDVLNSIPNLTVNRSCGLHVHLDARDMTVAECSKVFTRYANYEEDIDLAMPRSRRGQARWCKSIKSRSDEVVNKESKSELGSALGYNGKYYKVNLTNIAQRGSIEFRQHSGTTEYTKISNWVKFLMDFVTKSIELANTNQTRMSFTGRRTVPFDIARKVVRAAGGILKWRGNRYFLNMGHGYETAVTLAQLESFYNPQNVQDFDYNAFLAFIGLDAGEFWTSIARSDSDNSWFEGIETQVQNYFENRIEELN